MHKLLYILFRAIIENPAHCTALYCNKSNAKIQKKFKLPDSVQIEKAVRHKMRC